MKVPREPVAKFATISGDSIVLVLMGKILCFPPQYLFPTNIYLHFPPSFVGTTACKSILVGLPSFDQTTHIMVGLPSFVGTTYKSILVGLLSFDQTAHRNIMLVLPSFVGTTCESILVGLPGLDRTTYNSMLELPSFVGTTCKSILVGLPSFDRMLDSPRHGTESSPGKGNCIPQA